MGKSYKKWEKRERYGNIRVRLEKALNRINPMKGASKEKLTQTKLSILKTAIINLAKEEHYEYLSQERSYQEDLKWGYDDNYHSSEKELEYLRGRRDALKELELLIIEIDKASSKVKKV